MDVRFAGDRRGVAQFLGHRHRQVLGRELVALRGEPQGLAQRPGRSMPGAEELGRKTAADRVLDILVHVRRGHPANRIIAAAILEHRLPGQFGQLGQHRDHAGVADGNVLRLARFADERERSLGFGQLHMPAQQRGRAKAFVGARISPVADPDPAFVEHADDRGDHGDFGIGIARQVGFDLRAQLGQAASEFDAAIELVRFLPGAVFGMIAVLAAAALIIAGGLNRAGGIGAVPRVLVCRGQADRIEPRDLRAGTDFAAAGIEILPAFARAFAGDAGIVAVAGGARFGGGDLGGSRSGHCGGL